MPHAGLGLSVGACSTPTLLLSPRDEAKALLLTSLACCLLAVVPASWGLLAVLLSLFLPDAGAPATCIHSNTPAAPHSQLADVCSPAQAKKQQEYSLHTPHAGVWLWAPSDPEYMPCAVCLC